MILIKPIEITDANFTSSTIPEPDASQGEVEWSAGTYNLGVKRIKSSTHRVYEVVADPSTTDDPEEGVNKNPATWIDVGATNKWKMFDEANNTQSVGDNIVVELNPNQLYNGVGAFNVSCDSITVSVIEGATTVYTKSIEMRDRPFVDGWYNWFFSGIEFITRFILIDLPPANTATLRVEFGGVDAKVGVLSFGRQFSFGDAQYGTSSEIIDFSNPTEDQFGNISFSQGFTADLVNYKVHTMKSRLGQNAREIKTLGKQRPAIWIGDPSQIDDSTAVYGYNRDYKQTYDSPTVCTVNITVRGIV